MQKRVLSLLLTLLLICSLSACSPQTAGNEQTEASTTAAPAVPQTFLLDARYVVIRGEEEDGSIEAAQYVRAAIEAVCGEAPDLVTDWVKRGQEVKPGEYEILVGATNRTESAELAGALRRRDWAYRIVREGQILICGGDGESTLEAAKAFCTDVLGYTGGVGTETAAVEVEIGSQAAYTHTYPVTAVTLGGRSITDYKLIIPKSGTSYRKAAAHFNDLLAEVSGIELPIEEASETSAEYRILVGTQTSTMEAYEYAISSEGNNLVLDGGSIALPSAVDRFLRGALTGAEDEITLSLPTETQHGYGFGGEENGLVLNADQAANEKIAEGVTYSKRTYTDKKGAPVVAYVLTVEPGAAAVINGTPGGGTELHNVKATTEQAAKSAAEQGYTVLGGVNADFFRISEDFSPRGVCVKNGEVLSTATDRPFFGITKEGKPVCGTGSEVPAVVGELQEAVGGSHVMLRDGEIDNVGYGTEFGYTRHPRTAVGYDDEGRIFLLAVDGRQPDISNGASLSDLALIFLELGATHAVNLDGGGSTTFILANENGDGFRTCNSPSDGRLRSVYNSLLVVANR